MPAHRRQQHGLFKISIQLALEDPHTALADVLKFRRLSESERFDHPK
jgi:hypothetical protein